MSKLTKATILLAIFFAVDKCLAIFRQIVTARLFGLSAELDAFNVANNLPDMLFALISGGALAMAFIPVLTESLTRDGQKASWGLFSRIANLAFLVTTVLAVLVAIFAGPLVRLGVAPGFSLDQQALVVKLMRLNLIATMIFSISGLVIAGLQANKHFLLPAIAPLLYNIGQIFGATILAPEVGYQLGPITLPAFGLGITGLVYGVIIGAALHLAIQIPGLIHYKFEWTPRIDLKNPEVVKVLKLIGPRVITMFFIQLIFIARDNMASHLTAGAVSALTYAWMIMQVPETLIGTAIATAMLPTLSEQIARGEHTVFRATLERAIRVYVAATIPIAVILSLGLRPLVQLAFGFDLAGTDLMMTVTYGYMAGLLGQCLMEVAARSFYARQDAIPPLIMAAFNCALFVFLGSVAFSSMGAAGISLADAVAYTSEALILLFILNFKYAEGEGFWKRARQAMHSFTPLRGTVLRTVFAALVVGAVTYFALNFLQVRISPVIASVVAMCAAGLIMLPIQWSEVRLLFRL